MNEVIFIIVPVVVFVVLVSLYGTKHLPDTEIGYISTLTPPPYNEHLAIYRVPTALMQIKFEAKGFSETMRDAAKAMEAFSKALPSDLGKDTE